MHGDVAEHGVPNAVAAVQPAEGQPERAVEQEAAEHQ